MFTSNICEARESEYTAGVKSGLEIISFDGIGKDRGDADRYLAQVFRRVVREESLNKVFFDGSVRNTTDFIEFFKSRDIELFFVEFDGREVGFFWLKKFIRKAAFITYCFYRDFWGDRALEISRMCIEHLFERKDEHGGHVLDVLMGLTPAGNKLANNFLRKNGMSIMGRVPEMLYDCTEDAMVDGVFTYLQRNGKTGFKFPAMFFLH